MNNYSKGFIFGFVIAIISTAVAFNLIAWGNGIHWEMVRNVHVKLTQFTSHKEENYV